MAGSDLEVFWRSLVLVGVAELFDKTWIMGLLLALRYRASTVFAGSFIALFLHTVLAAVVGLAFHRFLSPPVVGYMAAAVFLCFTVLYAKDWYRADPESDAIENGKEEAAADDVELRSTRATGAYKPVALPIGQPADVAAYEPVALPIGQPAEPDCADEGGEEDADEDHLLSAVEGRLKIADPSKAWHRHEGEPQTGLKAFLQSDELVVFGKSFMTVFVAEWGDRTQIAMVGQHASQPLLPVFLGSCAAFFLVTLSAVAAATMLNGQKIREKAKTGVSACFFAVFFVLALRDAVMASLLVMRKAGH